MPTASKPKTFMQKIAAAAGEMENPKKRATNPHFKSMYANLEGTMDVIEPVLEKHGLSHLFFFDGTILNYQVFDPETEDLMQSSLDLKDILVGLDGNVWQQIGQAFTYLRRYLAQAFWGLVPEDDDANSAPSRPAAQRKAQQAGPVHRPPVETGMNEDSNGGGAL